MDRARWEDESAALWVKRGGGYGSENDVCLGYELRLAEPTQQKVQ